MILFVGSNPSNRSPMRNAAFDISTRSGTILASWTRDIRSQMRHVNVLDEPTPGNRPLTNLEIVSALPALRIKIESMKPDHIVTLGRAAATAINLLGLKFYEMPHPSGLNRKLNDKQYVETMIKGLHSYIGK